VYRAYPYRLYARRNQLLRGGRHRTHCCDPKMREGYAFTSWFSKLSYNLLSIFKRPLCPLGFDDLPHESSMPVLNCRGYRFRGRC
jgi:hypothetical protein